MTTESLAALWADYMRLRTVELRNALALEYTDLVTKLVATVLRSAPTWLWSEQGALAAAGNIALLSCIEAYRPEMGTSFSVFARYRMLGGIRDEMRAIDHLSRQDRHKTKHWEAAEMEVATRFGRQPTTQEIEDELSDVHNGRCKPSIGFVQLERQMGRMRSAVDERGELFARWTAGMPVRQRTVLRLRFLDGLSPPEIATALGIATQKVYSAQCAGLNWIHRRHRPGKLAESLRP